MTGIVVRHGRPCALRRGGKCSCKRAYEAWVYDPRKRGKRRKCFADPESALRWRRLVQDTVNARELKKSSASVSAHEAYALMRRAAKTLDALKSDTSQARVLRNAADRALTALYDAEDLLTEAMRANG